MSRSIFRWTALGALFGVCFPFVAVALRWLEGGSARVVDTVTSDPLLWIVFTAPLFLGAFAALGGRQQDAVRDLADGLEETVEDRTRALSEAMGDLTHANETQQHLLNGLTVGIASFCPSGVLTTTRSATLGRLLPGSEGVDTVDELLHRYAGIAPGTTELVRELLWDDAFFSPFEPTIAMLNTRFEVEGRTLQTAFTPMMGSDGALQSVLLQVIDHTDEETARREQLATEARVRRIALAADAPAAFARFRVENERLLRQAGRGDAVLRALHTLKGNTRMFGFDEVAAMVHAAEDAFEAGEDFDLDAIEQKLMSEVDDLVRVLGLHRLQGKLLIDRHAFLRVAASTPEPHATSLLDLTRMPSRELLHPFKVAAEALAERRDSDVQLSIAGDDLRSDELAPLEAALTHTLTNAVCHAARPGRAIQVHIQVERREGVHITVRDDGRGIDGDLLAQRAVAAGHWTPQTAASAEWNRTLELVFVAGVTTAAELTESAGRGVGLHAAKSALEAIGGSAQVSSTPGQGSCFHFFAPLPNARPEQEEPPRGAAPQTHQSVV